MAKQHKGMVDVSQKKVTKRSATAVSTVVLGAKGYNALKEDRSPKGNVLEAAKFAAIMAAKNTPQLIPMCHPLSINQVRVDFQMNEKNSSVTVAVEVNCEAKTGVEMEAMVGASVAALTIYDMIKWIDKAIEIKETKLMHKTGGKSGTFKRK